MNYRPPVKDITTAMRLVGGSEIAKSVDLNFEDLEMIVDEAGKFAQSVLLPLHRSGDKQSAKLSAAGEVTTSPGWKEAYKQWVAAGWNGLASPADFGGQGLPDLLHIACMDIWDSANVAFTLGPLLTAGAVNALQAHGSEALKQLYLEKMIQGSWAGTMNLTESQAGSDLSALRTRAEPQGDGTYLIKGQKIFITYGEHDLSENIIHFVLARLPEAPAGTRGISLFLVPKFIPNADGSPGERNDVRCVGLEHKMGMHGSPTCTLVFGEKQGARGWLVGEENRGLNCMFTMMNHARLGTAIQGVGIAEAATQHALAYARERIQGRASGQRNGSSTIIHHPDVQRMILTMQSQTQAARLICYSLAACLDRSHQLEDASAREANASRAALLTPLAKAFASDVGVEVASIGIQVFGGMGFIEETGAAQFLRDSRIVSIYEGTNGIQAIDLIQRKLTMQDGAVIADEIKDMRAAIERLSGSKHQALSAIAPILSAAVAALETAGNFIAGKLQSDADLALAGATPYLRLFALARGGTLLAEQAQADPLEIYLLLACFFAENMVVAAPGLEQSIVTGGSFVHSKILTA